jgi:hypothetical protein
MNAHVLSSKPKSLLSVTPLQVLLFLPNKAYWRNQLYLKDDLHKENMQHNLNLKQDSNILKSFQCTLCHSQPMNRWHKQLSWQLVADSLKVPTSQSAPRNRKRSIWDCLWINRSTYPTIQQVPPEYNQGSNPTPPRLPARNADDEPTNGLESCRRVIG